MAFGYLVVLAEAWWLWRPAPQTDLAHRFVGLWPTS